MHVANIMREKLGMLPSISPEGGDHGSCLLHPVRSWSPGVAAEPTAVTEPVYATTSGPPASCDLGLKPVPAQQTAATRAILVQSCRRDPSTVHNTTGT